MSLDAISVEVRKFIEEGDEAKRPAPAPDVNLFDAGYFDSLKIVNLVIFVEENFHLTLDYDDLTEENLGTIDNIVALIESKTAAGAPIREH